MKTIRYAIAAIILAGLLGQVFAPIGVEFKAAFNSVARVLRPRSEP